MKLARLFTLALLIGLAIAFSQTHTAAAKPAGSTDILVTSTTDSPDANVGDGKCKSTAGGCTLRAAVMEANVDPGYNHIILNPGRTYSLASPLGATTNFHIYGGGQGKTIIQGTGQNAALLDIQNGAHVELLFLTLRNGTGSNGGAVRVRAGGYLGFTFAAMENNHADGHGGAVYNEGELTLSRAVVSGNTAVGMGGAIYNTGTLRLYESTFLDNESSGSDGGALANQGSADLNNVTFGNNRASHAGGAIMNYPLSTLHLYSTTVAYNKANTSTTNQDGGGIHNLGALTALNSLVAFNKVESGLFDTDDDCGGTITSQGGNLLTTIHTCSFSDPVGTSLVGVSPLLGALSTLNGGFTPTFALLPGSVGIDLTPALTCASSYGDLVSDQRGYPRIVDGNHSGTAQCDAGAFESDAPDPCLTVPEAPVLVSPAANEKSKKRMRLIEWSLDACMTSFNVIIRQDNKNGAVVDQYNQLFGWSYMTKKLARHHTYFVNVEACNAHGCTSTMPRKFTVK